MNYQSLILDIDGTLWDSRGLVAEGFNLQLTEEGYPHLCVTVDDLTPLFGKVMQDLADTLLATVSKEERYDLMIRCMEREHAYMATHPCQVGYPRVRETLEQLSHRYRLFIVSNSQTGYPQMCMEKLGLNDFIEGHLCFGDTGTTKGQTIRTLMEKHNIGSCVYIGDTQGDYEAAVIAGTPFVWCAYGFGTPDDYAIKVDAFEELKEVL